MIRRFGEGVLISCERFDISRQLAGTVAAGADWRGGLREKISVAYISGDVG